ncbi:MAG: hypothetical protein VKI42_09010 [Synechococcaceae cyanobacterium]|nr:hypothetical protein [Synechococcaceae cyanobacterium]
MAQTVTFSGGAFNITDTPNPGTQALSYAPSDFNSSSGAPSYAFKNSNNSTIVGLGFQDNSPSGLNLTVSSRSAFSVQDSTFSFGDAKDTLLIGSSKDSQYFMGNGNNEVTISYRSQNDVINFGTGADTLTFGGSVNKTLVQLTTDSSVDTIKMSDQTKYTNLRITGATDIDVLFIGSTQYQYSSASNLWVNTANPGDTKNFS